ncbi:unnamed protein product, partial [Iphiclides podalirius]
MGPECPVEETELGQWSPQRVLTLTSVAKGQEKQRAAFAYVIDSPPLRGITGQLGLCLGLMGYRREIKVITMFI